MYPKKYACRNGICNTCTDICKSYGIKQFTLVVALLSKEAEERYYSNWIIMYQLQNEITNLQEEHQVTEDELMAQREIIRLHRKEVDSLRKELQTR